MQLRWNRRRRAARRRSAAQAVEALEGRVLLSYTLNTLASFNVTDGLHPEGGLVMDGSGNLYGSTSEGGVNSDGNIFEMAKGSNSITTLASFDTLPNSALNASGASPLGNLVIDSAGNLYGTTEQGGADGAGTVFELAKGSSTLTVLGTFNQSNGADPFAGMVMDSSGNLYGTTVDGGTAERGAIFEIAKGSNSITLLASFPNASPGSPGANPVAGLVLDGSGNLFGTTSQGSTGFDGSVFELAKGSSTITTVASFDGTDTGENSTADLVIDSAGDLFGTTKQGGNGTGIVFEVKNGSNSMTVLDSFASDGSNGSGPAAGLVMDGVGNLYGTTQIGGGNGTYGVAFEITASSIAGGQPAITDLVSFPSANNGAIEPFADLLIDGKGDLYGTTYEGGSAGAGAIFEVTASTAPSPVLVNVAFTTVNHGRFVNTTDAVQQGAAARGGSSDLWNNAYTPYGTVPLGANMDLTASNGGSSGVELSYSSDGAYYATSGSPFASTSVQNLMEAYLYSNEAGGGTVTLSDLAPNTQFDLYLYSGANDDGRETSLTVNGATQTTTFNGTLGILANGVSYAEFLVTSTGQGVVAITIGPGGGGTEGDLNGLQLKTHTSSSSPLTLTTPATATSVNVGDTYSVHWSGGSPADTVQIWAEGGPNNAWAELSPGTGLPENQGQYTWNTTGVLHGWYYFTAWDIPISGAAYSVVSPNYLHVVNPAVTQPPAVTLTNPVLAGEQDAQGSNYTINWTATEQGTDTNPLFVQLWAHNGTTNAWSILPNANAISTGTSGAYVWNTTNVAPGWYSFTAHISDGDVWGTGGPQANSPGWVQITVAAPTITYLTPTSSQSTTPGGMFSLQWSVSGLSMSDIAASMMQIWAQHLVNGTAVWVEIAASVDAATGSYNWTVPTSPGNGTYYAFSMWMNYGADWWIQASPNWVHVT